MSAKHRQKPTKQKRAPTKAKAAISQVRIIGGQFKRQWVSFIDAEGLRPSPDRLRETLFNWLQFDLHEAHVLDLCAGSGVLGFEALSRGAQQVTFIELLAQQAQQIAQTAHKLKLTTDQFRIYVGDAQHVLTTELNPINNIQPNCEQTSHTQPPYHLIFLDPPYDSMLWVSLLNILIQQQLVDSNTLLYIEDRRELKETLSDLMQPYKVLKSTKIGQIFASLIQISL
ncbi:16S rRNA (guanine(966)-N(2))-methyltransferase RsmD [Psychrobacter lutiphocae]|uniref:16S rRNA (guanine(966)-N(2))-methyltransferase RsmD n=1 Tax=Psychrobacter lutiphocae TaxID=540500 RepID=UPI0003636828|nr:16S rRNA (guanine(966)-N(2))-methyltransferase RsmD [Psychrobacter lutiphocae]